MSDLSSQLSAFKNRIRAGPSVAVRRAVTPKPVTKQVVEEPPHKRNGDNQDSNFQEAKRQKQEILEGVSGAHLSTRLHLAVEYIKQQDTPILVKKLEGYLSFDITHTLLPLLKEIDRIKYDPATNTLEYMSLHNIRTADDLLNFLRLQPTFKGTSVKELRDGWSGCLEAISKLEEDNKILVLRNKKENAPRLVWANLGGEIGNIDEEFVELWNKIRVPDRDSLYQVLVDNSLKPTGEDPQEMKKKPQQQERKQKKARRGKITNTHMKGILKDYSQLV
ncbi:transcription initiation factor IIE, beta subunit [Metschnikowia bicuspidata var. bicuspidata NRRL YB-4993]|uniref:Transcription initiation factor IIE subunit beta n=1 Tax=Metschnikowia bicuspidata var. bicuspidata NRRL YB-4993 TaxID=869754 RepID=A0A1A0H710_9ASCO|nr:transcription initiation factor IIE, beta subunit [Metschnikowia bicuspidata var. bicuspidata NRRL YB-4993]OBA19821.1 transcription initiation factor IIE, beta subunit [Metschnikowia bicuspidata var. bicuspidata NRRL YB-4993]